ncbi:MAG TPA: hypothetical protein GXZ59_04995 [Clostridiaceae bacterium]|nr:hypothetical protein [Clostridiaceae bacterium]
MAHIINLALLSLASIFVSFYFWPTDFPLLAVLIFLLISSFPVFFYLSQKEKYSRVADRVTQIIYFILIGISFFLPGVMAGLPLLAYQIRDWKQNWPLLFSLVPVLYLNIDVPPHILIILLTFGAVLLGHWTRRSQHLQIQFYNYVDNSSEQLRRQRQINTQLETQREIDRSAYIMSERNRIARSIHDNVGHKLTSGIIQLKALELSSGQEDKNDQYLTLSSTLSEAMDMIRTSIHDIHSDSLSIEAALKKLTSDYEFCPINLLVHIKDSPGSTLYYTIMAICREGLNNTAKHSNASKVDISLKQWGNDYQLLITDNGYNSSPLTRPGMGLLSMEERATAIGGSMHINRQETGFRIFVRLPAIK